MTGEQIIQFTGIAAGVIFGGGGLAALLGVFVTRKLGIKTSENEANRDINSTWDAIVDNLQGQINSQSENFRAELSRQNDKIVDLTRGQAELTFALGAKERLVLRAIAHIGKLELLVPPNPVPPRPEGLE